MPPQPSSYEEWFKIIRLFMSTHYTQTQCDEFARRLAELFVYTTAERLTDERVEYFCSGVTSLYNLVFEEAQRIPDENLVTRFFGTKPRPQAAQEVMVHVFQFIGRNLLPLKRSLAKSPIFYRMICQLLGDPQTGVARNTILRDLLPKTGRGDGVDFAALLQEPNLHEYCFTALRRLKDGRFVREAEAILANAPDDDPCLRQALRRYLDLFAAPQN